MKEVKKISNSFIINQYRSGISSYADFTKEVGLWESEEYIFEKYLKHDDQIADIGCGTGRTTISLYQKGYLNICGIDLTPEMIREAKDIQASLGLSIDFTIGDATKLNFESATFDVAIFSFNGLMSIPSLVKREEAIGEINRILNPGGLFIFTTHDRNKEQGFFEFWKTEEMKWFEGKQDQSLYEFGDILAFSKNESRQIYIHIPDQKEVVAMLDKAHFKIVETFYRSDVFNESAAVKEKSGECRFWVFKKR